MTSKGLKAYIEQLAALHPDCMTKAEDFEAVAMSCGEESKAPPYARLDDPPAATGRARRF